MSNALLVGGIKSPTCILKGSVSNSRNISGTIAKRAVLVGGLTTSRTLYGSISGSKCLAGSITKRVKLSGSLAIAYNVGAAIYTGKYEVVPSMEEQVLNTAMKMMHKDVCVKSIPIHRISNASGGTTVYIGKEVL